MRNQNIPIEVINLLSEEEIILFKELQIILKELNRKTNLTRLIDGDDFWISQVFDSVL